MRNARQHPVRYVGIKVIESILVGGFLFYCLAYEHTLNEWGAFMLTSFVSAVAIDYLNGDIG